MTGLLKRLGLGARIALLFAGSIAATALSVFGALSIQAEQETRRHASTTVQIASQALSRLIRADAQALEARCRLTVAQGGVGPLILSGHKATVDDFLVERARSLEVDGTTVVDRNGRLVGSSDRERFGHPPELADGEVWRLVPDRGEVRIAVRSLVADPASGEVQGAFYAFRTVDARFAANLALATGTHIAFTWDDIPIATSGPSRDEPAFESRYPVPGDGTEGRLGLVVRIPRSEVLGNLEAHRATFAGCFGAALVLGLMAAFRVARHLTDPLDRVVAAAQALRAGAWPEPLRSTRTDEFGLLESVFDEMADALRCHQLVSIRSLAATVDARDPYTKGHSDRVAATARELAVAMGLSETLVQRVHMVGTLHDIGKLAIPDAVLLKPGALNPLERAVIETHPLRSAQIVAEVPSLAATVPGIRHHHERWDGGGYPDGLAGAQIPLEARIVAVADAFDAFTTDRPYRRGWSRREALEEIARTAGTQFDPEVVRVFQEIHGAPGHREERIQRAA